MSTNDQIAIGRTCINRNTGRRLRITAIDSVAGQTVYTLSERWCEAEFSAHWHMDAQSSESSIASSEPEKAE